MSEWRVGPGKQRLAAWLSLDTADNEPIRFLAYLIAALESASPNATGSTASLLQSPQPPPLDSLVTSLLEALSGLATDLILALEDYHLITNKAIHQVLNGILDHLPPGFHLVILTRADPPLPLSRLRARNQLTEIRASALRFTRDEVASFLSQTMGLSLSAELVASLEARTEGWIAGLQLAALSMQGRGDVEDFVAAFTGSHHYVVDYLVDEVLSRQSEKMRDFLLRTSLLARMNASLCNALTGETDGQSVLEELHRSNLFIVALDDERQWYRYHHLFGDVLRDRLRQADMDVIPQLHLRAAEWLERSGFLSEAIAHAFAAQDMEFAAQMVDKNSAALLMRGEMPTLLQWMEAIDPILHRRASLCISKAWALAFTNRSEVIDDLIRETETLIAGDAASPIWGDIAALRAYLAGVRGQTREAIEFGREALVLLPENNLIVHGVVNLTLGGAYWWEGDLDKSAAAFERSYRIGLKVGSAHLASTALCGLSNRCSALGELHRARDYCAQALQVSTGKDGKLLPTAADACIGIGNLFYEWNDLATAEKHLNEGIHLIRLLGRVSTLADGQISLARLRQAQGDLGQAADLLKEAETHQQSSILHPAINARLAATKMELSLRMGNIDSAKRVAKQYGYSVNHPITYNNSTEYIQFAYFLLASKDAAQASTLASILIESAASHGWNDLLVRANILQAEVLAEQGQTSRAVHSMRQALNLARPGSYMRVFLDRGETVKKILDLVKPENEGQKDYVFKLLVAFAGNSTSINQPLIEPLSERELEVLRLVALGKSNQQIADELVLATGTVKKHLNNIFGKLNVRNRTECVVRARELNLL